MNDNNEIIVKKNSGYTAMSNFHLRDRTLSFKADWIALRFSLLTDTNPFTE